MHVSYNNLNETTERENLLCLGGGIVDGEEEGKVRGRGQDPEEGWSIEMEGWEDVLVQGRSAGDGLVATEE